jgi:hypothetical protein
MIEEKDLINRTKKYPLLSEALTIEVTEQNA